MANSIEIWYLALKECMFCEDGDPTMLFLWYLTGQWSKFGQSTVLEGYRLCFGLFKKDNFLYNIIITEVKILTLGNWCFEKRFRRQTMCIQSTNTNTIWLKFLSKGISTTFYRIAGSCESCKSISDAAGAQKDQATPFIKDRNYIGKNLSDILVQNIETYLVGLKSPMKARAVLKQPITLFLNIFSHCAESCKSILPL